MPAAGSGKQPWLDASPSQLFPSAEPGHNGDIAILMAMTAANAAKTAECGHRLHPGVGRRGGQNRDSLEGSQSLAAPGMWGAGSGPFNRMRTV